MKLIIEWGGYHKKTWNSWKSIQILDAHNLSIKSVDINITGIGAVSNQNIFCTTACHCLEIKTSCFKMQLFTRAVLLVSHRSEKNDTIAKDSFWGSCEACHVGSCTVSFEEAACGQEHWVVWQKEVRLPLPHTYGEGLAFFVFVLIFGVSGYK